MYISWDAPVPDVTSITAVRDYVLDLHNKIIQVGLVQTSHPNQFDFVSEPDQPNDTSSSTTKTYKPLIYRFNDNLIQTYIKITFGKCNSGSSELNRQRMFSIVEIGLSINPDGTFTNLPVCRYFNCDGYIGTSPTYTSKNGNSHISKFDNGSAFTLLATPGYSYTTYASSNTFALCLISLERTSTDVVINTYNTTSTFTNFSTSSSGAVIQAQYVLSKYSYDNPIYSITSLVKLMSTASNLYPLINYRSGGNITKSKVVYYYSQVSPLPATAMLPFVENGKTILPIGNFMSRYSSSGNYFIAYCMEDINEV